MNKRQEKIVWKKSVRNALICGLICAVLISGCGSKNEEAPSSYTSYKSDAQSISPIISSTSHPESDISNPASEFQKRLEPVQLKYSNKIMGDNVLKISANRENADYYKLVEDTEIGYNNMDLIITEIYNGTFICESERAGGGASLGSLSNPWNIVWDSSVYPFMMDDLICLASTEGSITLLDGMGNPLDVSFQFDFGADTKTSPEKFSGIPERTLSVSTLREYYPYGVSYDEEKEWIIMCYKRSEFMVDGRMESGIAVFDLEGNLLLDLPTPEEYKEYIGGISGIYYQLSKGHLGVVSWFEMLPVEGELLVIPVEYYTCLLVDLERQSWELVEREQVEAMLQGSGWRIEWKSILGTRLLPEQEPVELTIVPGEESTKLFLGDSEEPVFEIEGCYTADGYMIDKATGDIYTCLDKVLPGYGDNS